MAPSPESSNATREREISCVWFGILTAPAVQDGFRLAFGGDGLFRLLGRHFEMFLLVVGLLERQSCDETDLQKLGSSNLHLSSSEAFACFW